MNTKARTMRSQPTPAERHLWLALRDRRLGVKFRRQAPIGPYIVDFVCFDKRLIIEADGGQHTEEYDQRRDAWLKSQGFRVLHFWNEEILNAPDGVVQVIAEALAQS